MMTIEEKAKAYDEALEKARKKYDSKYHPDMGPGGVYLNNADLEEIFPQLRESEDERIRKELIERVGEIAPAPYEADENGIILKSYYDRIARYRAWLERQKEQKPVLTAKEIWEEMRLEVYAQASGNRHEPNCSDDSTKMFSLRDIDEIFEKIGNATIGSRPAEWSEADEDFINMLILHFNYMIDKEMKEGGTSVETYKSYREKLKSLRPSWKPSEVQSEGVEGVVHHCATVHYLATNTKQLNARLKDFEEGAEVRVFINAKKEGKK